ncbi:cleavage and polyadenylation specificity factor subunit 6-like isoform X2 [Tachypleus tridentatus]|uniref:cleavage and polyadenylation specificity factor subunit 6-like isoform X2 n=1 Tax=Tachypleus tridentatus TaxID=6853 RepID=UPI003FD21D83
MADGVDIDLYAEDLEHDFSQEGEYNHDSNVDLYDDVITASTGDMGHPDEFGVNQDGISTRSVSSSGGPPTKRVAIYVGNLTWWTTDQNVIDAINSLGVNDVLDVKFYENRANGQSKGFCVVTLGSENSFRIVMDKLPKKELHGQSPVVTPYNKQSLNHFEMQARKPSPGNMGREGMGRAGQPGGGMRERESRGDRGSSGMNRGRSNGPPNFPSQQHMHGHHGLPVGPPPPQGPPPQFNQGPPPPQMHHPQGPPPSRPGPPPMVGHPGMPPPPPGMQGPPPPRHGGPPPVLPGNIRVPPPHGPPLSGPRGPPPPDTRGPPPLRNEWDRPPEQPLPPGVTSTRPPHPGPTVSHPPPHPPPGLPPTTAPPPHRPPPPVPPPGPGMPPNMPPPTSHPPAPHVNPAFFPPHSQPQGMPTGPPPPSQPGDMYGRPPPNQYPEFRGPPLERQDHQSAPISDAEFEEIMNRNRTVSSSAIARAVADASAGDYASAIETLVTAISLIKQSKVANDDRCKILTSSLQDTLHGVESKSYGSRSKDRPRSRERDRSRERSSRREKSSRRDRSRSREKDYRDRSRDRERYYEDRHSRDKDRDRDREREHRSSRH